MNRFDPEQMFTYAWQNELDNCIDFGVDSKTSILLSNNIRQACNFEIIKVYFRNSMAYSPYGRLTKHSNSNYKYFNSKKERIRYVTFKDRVNISTILHEVAHSLLGESFHGNEPNPYIDNASHGPTFRRVLVELYEKYFGFNQNYSEQIASEMKNPLCLAPKINIIKKDLPFLHYADKKPIIDNRSIYKLLTYPTVEKPRAYDMSWEELIEFNRKATLPNLALSI